MHQGHRQCFPNGVLQSGALTTWSGSMRAEGTKMLENICFQAFCSPSSRKCPCRKPRSGIESTVWNSLGAKGAIGLGKLRKRDTILYNGCRFFLQLGASCLQLSFFAYSCVWQFIAYNWSFSTYSWSFFAYGGKVHLINTSTDGKQRSSAVSTKAPTVSKKPSPNKNSLLARFGKLHQGPPDPSQIAQP